LSLVRLGRFSQRPAHNRDGGRRNAIVSNYSGGGGAVDRGFRPAAPCNEGTRANLSLPVQPLPPENAISRGESRTEDHVPALFAALYCPFGDTEDDDVRLFHAARSEKTGRPALDGPHAANSMAFRSARRLHRVWPRRQQEMRATDEGKIAGDH